MYGTKKYVVDMLGPQGRIFGSKGRYSFTHPSHHVVYNANICLQDGTKLWYGDVDITLEYSILAEMALVLKKDIYLLYEMAARFENESDPKLSEAVVVFKSSGTISYRFMEYLTFTSSGAPYLKIDMPEKPKHSTLAKYNIKDFTPILLPLKKHLNPSKSKTVLDRFHDYFIDKTKNLEAAKALFANLYITKEYEDLILDLVYDDVLKNTKDEYEAHKAKSWACLYLPKVFDGTPEWAIENVGYISLCANDEKSK